MNEQELYFEVNWRDPNERSHFLDDAEASFAEARYVEENPPTPAQFVASYTEGIPGLEAPWPPEARKELLERCEKAALLIAIGDREYEHWRNIETKEDRRAARERRRRAKTAIGRWYRSNFTDMEAFFEMDRATGEMRAEGKP